MWAVWWNNCDGVVHFGSCVVFVGLLVGAQDGIIVGVVCPFPSSLASGLLRILNLFNLVATPP